MWTYHAVAAVLAHSFSPAPRSRQGPYGRHRDQLGRLSDLHLAGLDDRVKVAVPVYGCGFLDENSAWMEPRFKMWAPRASGG